GGEDGRRWARRLGDRGMATARRHGPGPAHRRHRARGRRRARRHGDAAHDRAPRGALRAGERRARRGRPGRDVTPLGELRTAVQDAAASLRGGVNSAGAPPTLERARKPEFGDYSTNAAMLLAPVLGEPPRAIAERLAETLSDRLGDRLDRVEVAGPG